MAASAGECYQEVRLFAVGSVSGGFQNPASQEPRQNPAKIQPGTPSKLPELGADCFQ